MTPHFSDLPDDAARERLARKVRDETRMEEYGTTDLAVAGGQCGLVCEGDRGSDGGIIILRDGLHVPDHFWIVLDDGRIFDPTCDQFGANGYGFWPTDPTRYHSWCDCAMCEATPCDRDPFYLTPTT